jgi:hypothetical protein
MIRALIFNALAPSNFIFYILRTTIHTCLGGNAKALSSDAITYHGFQPTVRRVRLDFNREPVGVHRH